MASHPDAIIGFGAGGGVVVVRASRLTATTLSRSSIRVLLANPARTGESLRR
jgi:hypothetical protein